MKYYQIDLISPGPAKLQVIKIVKETTELGLEAAKYLVDVCPSMIIITSNRTKARKCAKLLREAKATIKSFIITIN